MKAVLNLRQPSEHRAADEQAAVEAAGLKYFNIPVVYANPTDAEADQFLKITDDAANRPMFIHCTAAIRVGAFWAIRRAVRDGLTPDAALEEGRKVGLINAPHLEEFVRTYIASHPPQKEAKKQGRRLPLPERWPARCSPPWVAVTACQSRAPGGR